MRPRESLGDRGLAHARLADEHRVVLRAPREHLDDAADLVVATDHRVELALARVLGEVAAEALERLVLLLGVLARDAVAAAHFLQRAEHRVVGDAEPAEQVADAAGDLGHREEQVLGGEVVVAEVGALAVGGFEHRVRVGGQLRLLGGLAVHLGQAGERLLDPVAHDLGSTRRPARAPGAPRSRAGDTSAASRCSGVTWEWLRSRASAWAAPRASLVLWVSLLGSSGMRSPREVHGSPKLTTMPSSLFPRAGSRTGRALARTRAGAALAGWRDRRRSDCGPTTVEATRERGAGDRRRGAARSSPTADEPAPRCRRSTEIVARQRVSHTSTTFEPCPQGEELSRIAGVRCRVRVRARRGECIAPCTVHVSTDRRDRSRARPEMMDDPRPRPARSSSASW